jgi:hypothetical protein
MKTSVLLAASLACGAALAQYTTSPPEQRPADPAAAPMQPATRDAPPMSGTTADPYKSGTASPSGGRTEMGAPPAQTQSMPPPSSTMGSSPSRMAPAPVQLPVPGPG